MKVKLLLVFGILLLFSSCAKFPQAEINNTSSYVDSVKEAFSSVPFIIVPDSYQILLDSLETVKNLAKEEKSKMFSNYEETLNALISIDSMSIDVMKYVEKAKIKIDTTITEVFYVVEEMPIFQDGGEKSLEKFRNYIQSNIKYPAIAMENGISGTIYVNFIINKDGDICNINIVRGVDPSLDNVVIEALKNAPSWIPGKQRGENVAVSMAMPIKFILK